MSCSMRSCLAVICFFVLSILSEQWVRSEEQHHHVISIRSLLSGTNCSSSLSSYNPAAGSPPGTLPVVHRACSPAVGKQESASDHVALLHRDQFRVETIHRHHRADSLGSATTAQTRLGLPFSSLEYVVTIGIGSPERDLTVVVDTGSDLTWVQCEPCSSCYSQEEPLFEPRGSITYEEVGCADQDCFMLSGGTASCGGTACVYSVDYGDDSYSSGYLARESVTLSPNSTSSSNTLTGVLFGCGALRNGGFGESRVAGILGLGQGVSSVVSQTSAIYNGVFSYCLPPRGSATGYLAFGTAPLQPNIQYTPLVLNPAANPSYYSVELTSIAVAGRSLAVAPSAFAAGTIVDSGTVVTRLPPVAYAALRAEFRRHMSGRYPVVSAVGRVLECYNVTGHDEVVVPGVALLFGGGARLDVDASGILLVADVSLACLAFAPNADPGSLSIIGNMQQRANTMVFDVDGGRVGFGANGCI